MDHLKSGKVEQEAKLAPDKFTSGLLTCADSLEELADRLHIDRAALRYTVENFNRHAKHGEDPEFHRGATEHAFGNGRSAGDAQE